jgi:Tfp pilus assembly protein PilZ
MDLRVVIHYEGPEDLRDSHTADISEHGVYIRTTSEVTVGTTVYLELDVGPETIAIDGRVVRVMRNGDEVEGIGVEFTDIGSQAAARLRELITPPS